MPLGDPPPNGTCNSGTSTSPIFQNLLSHKENYIPTGSINERTVPKKVKVRIQVAQPSGSTQRNFANTPADIQKIQDMVAWMNSWLANTDAPTKPQTNICGTCHIPDTRIQLELIGITFFNNNDTFVPYQYIGNDANGNPKYNYMNNVPDLSSYVTDGDSVLNIFLCYFNEGKDAAHNNYIVPAPYRGVTNNLTNNIAKFNFYNPAPKCYIIMQDIYQSQFDANSGGIWFSTNILLHEIFHEYGLKHIFDEYPPYETCVESDPDFLADIFNVGALNHCLENGHWGDCNPASANYQNYTCDNNVIAVYPGRWTSPMQMGIMHRESYLGRMSRYTYPVEAHDAHPWMITSSQTWDFPMRVYQDIIVNPGTQLTIKCELQMPPDGRILIKPGGKLVVDGGLITSYHQKAEWAGIEVMGQKNQPMDPQHQGSLELKNGAIIEHSFVRNFTWDNGAQGGGIIQASNSYFVNSWRMVELNDYGNYSYYGNYPAYGNSSYCMFDHCSFIMDDVQALAGHNEPPDFFTSYNTQSGVIIKNCTFTNTIENGQKYKGKAIYTLGSGLKVINCSFDGFNKAIEFLGWTGIPTRNNIIYDNTINHATRGITVGGDAYGDIQGNTVNNMLNYYDVLPPAGPGPQPPVTFTVHAVGIYADNSRGAYIGCNNKLYGDIDDPGLGENSGSVGVLVNNSAATGATVKSNTFTDLPYGLQTQGNNPALNFTCNGFNSNSLAVHVYGSGSGTATYMKDQGTGCQTYQTRAGNTFTGNARDIASYINNQWQYYGVYGATQYPYNHYGSVTVTGCTYPGGGGDPNSQCSSKANGFIFTSCMRFIEVKIHLGDMLARYRQLKGQAQQYGDEGVELFNRIMLAYSPTDSAAALRTFLENENDGRALRLLIPLYIEAGQYAKVAPAIHRLNVSTTEKNAYTNYYSLVARLQQDGRRVDSLTPTELSLVQSLAADSLEVSPYAKAILQWGYGQEWIHPVEPEPASAMLYHSEKPAPAILDKSELYNAAPNPANGNTLIRVYITPDDAINKPVLILRDMEGKLINTYTLTTGDNNVTVATSTLLQGVYTYSLMINGSIYEVKKLSIIH